MSIFKRGFNLYIILNDVYQSYNAAVESTTFLLIIKMT